EKILALTGTSPKEHYKADAAIVWCFEHRFRQALLEFIQKKKIKNDDLICVAGGLQSLASGNGAEREFVLFQIQASIKLHAPSKIYLMVHSDCGKYGGLKNFGGDEAKELEFLAEEARKAKEYLAGRVPENTSIQTIFADWGGLWFLD
ncbi:MAG: hypothetical protein AAB904_00775, partial [Patescibacteria group bacterium]